MHEAMKIHNLFLTLALPLITSVAAVADDTPFNGVILNSELKPIKNIRVYLNDPNYYSLTDKQGRFGLTNILPDDTLSLRISKKQIIRVPVDGRQSMRIILAADGKADAQQDDELVNFGFGYVKRREFTGSSSGISGETLRRTGKSDILSALDGLVTGLKIKVDQQTGKATANVRNAQTSDLTPGSFTKDASPAFFVDGLQVPSLEFMSVHDVDHVEVIKDASLYGVQGASGVILVTTKSAAKAK